jgi:hypothetical protein
LFNDWRAIEMTGQGRTLGYQFDSSCLGLHIVLEKEILSLLDFDRALIISSPAIDEVSGILMLSRVPGINNSMA